MTRIYLGPAIKTATLTTILPSGRFGVLDIDENNRISDFREKSRDDSAFINGGFMVLNPEIFDLIEGDDTILERFPLEECARKNNLMAYKHHGFWQCMDTMRDKILLEELIEKKEAPWIKW